MEEHETEVSADALRSGPPTDADSGRDQDRRRGQFLNRLAHDLRTPLTTILLMVDLIRTTDSEVEVAEYWQILRDQVLREQALVEHLVRVGRFEARSQRLEPQAVDLARLVDDVVVAAAVTAVSRGLQLDRSVDPGLPRVVADPQVMRDVLGEVVANALRFTPVGGRIRLLAERAGEGVRVEVSDTGIGVPAADVPRLGEPFFRAANAPATTDPAAGLGLAMVRRAVEGVGGRLRVASVEGKGTSVEVWLRVA